MKMHEPYDPVVDDPADVQLELEPCPYCERKFSKLSRHVKVCKKLSKKSRPVFDSSKQRLSGISEQDKCLVKPVSPLHVRMEQKEAAPVQHPPQEKIWNRTKSYVMGLKDKLIHPKVKPRANSVSVIHSEPPRAKSEATIAGRIPENYVQCPSCDRWFGPRAADRHIEWCTSKIFRMPAGNVPTVTEKKRWENRVNYKAPLPGKTRLENRQKYGFGAPDVRVARGFSPPKVETSPFDRSGPRRTSLRGRRFGEPEDPLAYALGRQESPQRKQQVRRFLSSSAYRAEPDGIDHAALSKSSKGRSRGRAATDYISSQLKQKLMRGTRAKVHPFQNRDANNEKLVTQPDKMSTVEEEEEEDDESTRRREEERLKQVEEKKGKKHHRTDENPVKKTNNDATKRRNKRNHSESGISSSSSASSSSSRRSRPRNRRIQVETREEAVQVGPSALSSISAKSMPELARVGQIIVAFTRDGYEIHRSLLHENAARQLEELLMSSSSCSLGDLSMPTMSQSMHGGMDLGTSSSSLLMSTSLGPDSRHFMSGSPMRSSLGMGKSRIPRRSPSPHGPSGPSSLPSDEFLLNELMASDLLTPPQVKANGRKQACPPPSLQEMLYGGGKPEKGGEKGLGGAGLDDDDDKRESSDVNYESDERRSQETLSSPASTSSKASVIEATSAAQLVARQEKRESADGFTATSTPTKDYCNNSAAAPLTTKSSRNQIFTNLTNHPGSIPEALASASSPAKPTFSFTETPKPSSLSYGAGKSLFGEPKHQQLQQPNFSLSSPVTTRKATGLSTQPRSKTQELFASGLLGYDSKSRLSKMTSVESDDDVIAASHNVVTNIASEMGSLSLFDGGSSRLHRPSPSGSNSTAMSNTNNNRILGDGGLIPSPKRETQPIAAPAVPKFCHECGCKYPVSAAKFCCNCGARRVC